MKPNTKTLGGFIALVVPEETISWEAYKAKYGIDLDKIFKYVPDVGITIVTRKPILLCLDEEWVDPHYLPVSFVTRQDEFANEDGEYEMGLIGAGIYSSGSLDSYFGIRININRTIALLSI